MTFIVMPLPAPCPVCGKPPMVERCEPWPANHGPAPWYVGCYSLWPAEHYVGVNGNGKLDAVRRWNVEAAKIKTGDFETA